MSKFYKKISVILVVLLTVISIVPISLGVGTESFRSIVKNQIYNTLDSDQNITNLLKKHNVPGLSACIIKNNEVVWSKGYGYYNRLRFWKKPDGDTIYGTGCLTTTVTATALLQLYEKGLFDLDDDVNDYLDFNLRNPNFPEMPINFTMLLTHQSSLSMHLNTNILILLASSLGFLRDPYYLLKESLVPGGRHYKSDMWLSTSPGENANYSCIGIIVSAYLLERISGQSFETYCKENIFEPLDMKNSSFNTRNAKRKNLVVPYHPLSIPFLNKELSVLVRLPHGRGINLMQGTTGLLTTIDDLSHFLIAHMNGGVWNGNRILKESTVDLMHTIHVYNVSIIGTGSKFWGYGLGWGFYNESEVIYQGHGGEDEWSSSSSMIFRDSDNKGVIMLLSARVPEQYVVRAALRQELFKIADEL